MPRKKISAPAAAPTPAPQPLPPSPAVLQLQAKVADLIDQREQAMEAVTTAQAELHLAQAKVQTATARVQQIDQAVQYRMGVIAQMENRPAQTHITMAPQFPVIPGGLQGITSEPSIPMSAQFNSDTDMVNRAHATRADATDIRRVL